MNGVKSCTGESVNASSIYKNKTEKLAHYFGRATSLHRNSFAIKFDILLNIIEYQVNIRSVVILIDNKYNTVL